MANSHEVHVDRCLHVPFEHEEQLASRFHVEILALVGATDKHDRKLLLVH